MLGPCADKVVKCTIVSAYGEHFVGTNDCATPQAICPRVAGEGYDKCKSICNQTGHAEEVALRLAGIQACGAQAYIEGIKFVCRSCQEQLFAAGVESFSLMPPPKIQIMPFKKLFPRGF